MLTRSRVLFFLAPFFGLCCISPGLFCVGIGEIGDRFEASKEPIELTLADLSRMQTSEYPTGLVRLGPCYACYHEAAYSYLGREDEEQEMDDTVSSFYYPVVDPNDEYIQQVRAIAGEEADLESVSPFALPAMESYFVVVDTDRFGTLEDVPSFGLLAEEGLIGRIKTDRVSSQFPRGTIFFEELIIAPWWSIILKIIGGFICGGVSVAMIVSTVVAWFGPSNKKKQQPQTALCPHCRAPWQPNAQGLCSHCGRAWDEPITEVPEIRT